MATDRSTELSTQKYLNAGGNKIAHDKALLSAEYLCFYKLGRMLELGMPVLSCLKFLVNETTHEELKKALGEMTEGIAEGRGFAECMDKPVFTPSTIAMIKVGEVTGQVDRALLAVAECLGRQLTAF